MTVLPPALDALQRFARRDTPATQCEHCAAPLPALHRHLFDRARNELCCSCPACAQTTASDALPLVPTRVRALHGLELDSAFWRSLGIPVELAFIRSTTPDGAVVAVYPGPAGATHTEVRAGLWAQLGEMDPRLGAAEPDVEALLANRLEGPARYYLAPLDVCFQLVGLVRRGFAGFDGGPGLRAELRTFFAELDARAEVE